RNIVSSGAIWTPCARGYWPSPHDRRKLPFAVEHHHRMVSAIEDINIVVAVDPDPADLLERPAIRQLRPVGIDLISIVAASHDHRHNPSGDRFSLPQYEAQTGRKGKRGETLDSEIKRK